MPVISCVLSLSNQRKKKTEQPILHFLVREAGPWHSSLILSNNSSAFREYAATGWSLLFLTDAKALVPNFYVYLRRLMTETTQTVVFFFCFVWYLLF